MINNYEEWIFINKNEFERDKFIKVKNDNFIKPKGGLWLSPYFKDCKYLSYWHEFLINEMNRNIKGYKGTVFKIKKNARILTIDSLSTFKEIFELYELKTELDFKFFRILDFEKIFEKYDAILLTNRGQIETRFSEPNLYGWDIECMLVNNLDILEIKEIIDL